MDANIEKMLASSLQASKKSKLQYDTEFAQKILEPISNFSSSNKKIGFQQAQLLVSGERYEWGVNASTIELVSKQIFIDEKKSQISFVIKSPKNIPTYARQLFFPLIRSSNHGPVAALYTPTGVILVPSDLFFMFNEGTELNFLFSKYGQIKSGVRATLPEGLLDNFQYFFEWLKKDEAEMTILREEVFKIPAIALRLENEPTAKLDGRMLAFDKRPLNKIQMLEINYQRSFMRNFERVTRQFLDHIVLDTMSKILGLLTDVKTESQFNEKKWLATANALRLVLERKENENNQTYLFENFILKHENSGYLYFGVHELKESGEFGDVDEFELSNIVSLSRMLCILAYGNPRLSDMGKLFPFFDGPEIKYLNLTEICPDNASCYWDVDCEGFWWLDEIVEKNEFPLTAENFVNGFAKSNITRQESEELRVTHELLFDEASALKEFLIPPNAFVELRIGPFVGVSIHERQNDIILKWQTDKNEFLTMSMWPEKRAFSFQSFGDLAFLQDESEKVYGINPMVDVHEAAGRSTAIDRLLGAKQLISLISATIIRDYWVVDDRKEVFYVRENSTVSPNKKQPITKESHQRRVIYIPRRRYSNKIDLSKYQKTLNLSERVKHVVRQHLRRGSPTAAQRQLARLLGVNLPDGFTFVKSHFRGGNETQRVYRSISAIALASSADIAPIQAKNEFPTWFDFEDEVGRVQKLMGYEVLFKAPNFSGDGGIDLRVRKKTASKIEEVLIQCKCWKNTVGPDVIREMMGSLVDNQTDEVELRGAVYTTSKFSQEATALALKNNIQLVDGEAWAKLSNQLTHN